MVFYIIQQGKNKVKYCLISCFEMFPNSYTDWSEKTKISNLTKQNKKFNVA